MKVYVVTLTNSDWHTVVIRVFNEKFKALSFIEYAKSEDHSLDVEEMEVE